MLDERRRKLEEKKRLEEEKRLRIERAERDARLAEGVDYRRIVRKNIEELQATRAYEKTRLAILAAEEAAEAERVRLINEAIRAKEQAIVDVETRRLNECAHMDAEEASLRDILHRSREIHGMGQEDFYSAEAERYSLMEGDRRVRRERELRDLYSEHVPFKFEHRYASDNAHSRISTALESTYTIYTGDEDGGEDTEDGNGNGNGNGNTDAMEMDGSDTKDTFSSSGTSHKGILSSSVNSTGDAWPRSRNVEEGLIPLIYKPLVNTKFNSYAQDHHAANSLSSVTKGQVAAHDNKTMRVRVRADKYATKGDKPTIHIPLRKERRSYTDMNSGEFDLLNLPEPADYALTSGMLSTNGGEFVPSKTDPQLKVLKALGLSRSQAQTMMSEDNRRKRGSMLQASETAKLLESPNPVPSMGSPLKGYDGVEYHTGVSPLPQTRPISQGDYSPLVEAFSPTARRGGTRSAGSDSIVGAGVGPHAVPMSPIAAKSTTGKNKLSQRTPGGTEIMRYTLADTLGSPKITDAGSPSRPNTGQATGNILTEFSFINTVSKDTAAVKYDPKNLGSSEHMLKYVQSLDENILRLQEHKTHHDPHHHFHLPKGHNSTEPQGQSGSSVSPDTAEMIANAAHQSTSNFKPIAPVTTNGSADESADGSAAVQRTSSPDTVRQQADLIIGKSNTATANPTVSNNVDMESLGAVSTGVESAHGSRRSAGTGSRNKSRGGSASMSTKQAVGRNHSPLAVTITAAGGSIVASSIVTKKETDGLRSTISLSGGDSLASTDSDIRAGSSTAGGTKLAAKPGTGFVGQGGSTSARLSLASRGQVKLPNIGGNNTKLNSVITPVFPVDAALPSNIGKSRADKGTGKKQGLFASASTGALGAKSNPVSAAAVKNSINAHKFKLTSKSKSQVATKVEQVVLANKLETSQVRNYVGSKAHNSDQYLMEASRPGVRVYNTVDANPLVQEFRNNLLHTGAHLFAVPKKYGSENAASPGGVVNILSTDAEEGEVFDRYVYV